MERVCLGVKRRKRAKMKKLCRALRRSFQRRAVGGRPRSFRPETRAFRILHGRAVVQNGTLACPHCTRVQLPSNSGRARCKPRASAVASKPRANVRAVRASKIRASARSATLARLTCRPGRRVGMLLACASAPSHGRGILTHAWRFAPLRPIPHARTGLRAFPRRECGVSPHIHTARTARTAIRPNECTGLRVWHATCDALEALSGPARTGRRTARHVRTVRPGTDAVTWRNRHHDRGETRIPHGQPCALSGRHRRLRRGKRQHPEPRATRYGQRRQA
jgi:hypothetical protein